MLETKDTGASVLQKKRSLQKIFSSDLQKRKRSLQIFREVSGVFLRNLKNEQVPTIIGTDAHHTTWGSSNTNPRREDLLAHCVSSDLNFCIVNVGNKPTFRTKTREEVLDLTLVNRCAWDRVVGWHVSNVLSFSDHMYII